MEWARQRFRLALDSSDSGSSPNNKKLHRLTKNHSLVILFTTLCLLPSGVWSAAEVSGSSINSVNFNSYDPASDHKSQPLGAQIWRSIRQAGVLKRDGSPEKDASSGSSLGLYDFGNETESLTTLKTKRPILHRKAHPDAISRKDSLKDSKEDDNKLDKMVKNKLPQEHGEGHEGESKVDEEMEKIQSILRNIFLDEFQSEEELEDEETEESENALTHDLLSRSSQNDFKNKSQVPLSRHARSELQPEGRAGFKGKKGPKASQDSNINNNSSDGKADSDGSSTGRQKKKPSKGVSKGSKGSDLTKYNEYMDSVFRRMNTMIKSKKMDPLRVNLYAGASKNKKTSNSRGGGGGHKGRSPNAQKKQRNHGRMNLDSAEDEDDETELDEDDDDLENGPARRDIFLNISHQDDQEDPESIRKIRALLESVENATIPETSDSPRGSNSDSKPKKPKQSSANREKNTGNGNKSTKGQGNPGGNKKAGNKASGNKGSKKKNNRTQNTRPTRGILHGLSTLKRDGNVAVIKQGEQARIVRANFLLGPVSLEIMPKKGKVSSDGGKPVAATATASKLKGVLEVRLKKGSPTRIRRLRVYPPKNVKVEGTAQSLHGTKGNKKPQQYGKVTPMATARLRQIASTVVRQADKSKKSP